MLTFIALDFETANYSRHSACEIGLTRVEGGAVTEKASWFIRPPERRFNFTYLHGIDWDMVKDAPDFGQLMPDVAAFIDGADFIAAHNAVFDRSVMAAVCAYYCVPQPAQPFLCTVNMARRVWNIYPTKLDDVCTALDIDLGRHHRAGFDALACAEIVRKALEKLGEPKFRADYLPA
jgi:DNA polymerase III subunit epsilon